MLPRRLTTVLATACLLTASAAALATPADAAPRHFANCTALNKVYPHGVGRVGARDHVSSSRSKPVTNFTRNTAVYNVNTGSDRDHDHIACEKH